MAVPLFSIGVTTYDRVELLVQTLSSILGQTFSDFDVIIGNGDSPLRGKEFVSDYLAGKLEAIGTMGMFDPEYLREIGGLEDLSGGAMALYTEYLQIIKAGLAESIDYIDAHLVIYRAHEGS